MTEATIRAQHIGIVGCSAEGAALCYRTVCASGAALMGPYGHPEVSLGARGYVDCLDRGDWAGVADLSPPRAKRVPVTPSRTHHPRLPPARRADGPGVQRRPRRWEAGGAGSAAGVCGKGWLVVVRTNEDVRRCAAELVWPRGER